MPVFRRSVGATLAVARHTYHRATARVAPTAFYDRARIFEIIREADTFIVH